MSSGKVWENPDPGVKWALDLLSPDPDYEEISIYERYKFPLLTTVVAGFSRAFQLNVQRKPLRTGMHFTIAYIGLAMASGVYIRDMFEKKTTLNMAICRHYIMLHPERFPEPEMKKFGDKEVFYTWRFIR